MNETVAWIIYALFALGGAGLYLSLPRTGRSTRAAGAIIGLSAVAALLALMAGTWAVPGTHNGYFLLFAGVAIVGSARVVTHHNPVYSAVYFVLVVVAVAMIMVLQMAEFLAIAIIIIYAGAILVTYVFVIMLAQQHADTPCDRRAREPFGAVLVAFVLTAAVTGRVAELPTGQVPGHPIRPILVSDSGLPVEQAAVGNVTAIGQALLTQYVVALEIAGVLLLVAMVGAIALAKKKIPPDESAVKQRPLGEAGREVEPF